jgi:two-component system sensor kinase FixL
LTGQYLLGVIELSVGAMLAGNLLLLRRTGNVGFASSCGVAGVLVIVFFLFITGGVGGTGIFWFYFYPAIVFFLFGVRNGLIWLTVLYLLTFLLCLLSSAGAVTLFYSFATTVQMLASLLLESIMVLFYARVMEREERLIEEHNQKLGRSNAALQNEVAQRQRAEEELLRISKAVRSSSDAMIVAGPDGKYIFSNKAFYDLFRYTLSDVNRAGGYQALYPDPATGQQVLDTIKSGGQWHGEVAMQTKAGRTIQVFLRADAIKGADGAIMGLVANHTDISARKEAEKLQSALFRISELTSGTTDLRELCAGIHGIVGELMYADNFYIALHDPGTGAVSFPYFVDQHDPPPSSRPLGKGLTDYVIRTGKPLLASPDNPGVYLPLRASGEVEVIGTESVDWIGVPLVWEGRTIGALVVQNYTEALRVDEREQGILTFVSQHIAGAIARKQAQDQLRASEENFRRVISSINDHIYMTEFDAAGTPINAYISPNVADMTGYPLERFLTDWGFWPNTVIHPGDRAAAAAQVNRFLAGHDSEVEYRVVRADGSVIWVRDNGHAVKDVTTGTVTVFGAISDISQNRYYEEVREALLAALKKANTELADFAYIVSHDLKAPLRAISSLAGWLAEDYADKIDDRGREQIGLLLKRTKRMHNLIEGILAYSRLGRVKPVLAEVDSHETARQVIESLAPPGSISVGIEGHLPAVVYDRTHLEQLIQNLCSNAIKHLGKPAGRVTISCAEIPGFWEFCVRDDGAGIDPSHFDRIFKIFQTLKPRDEVESTGIGLTIVKKTVELYGGRVRVESAPDRGAAFFFTVPKGLKSGPENP